MKKVRSTRHERESLELLARRRGDGCQNASQPLSGVFARLSVFTSNWYSFLR